MMKKSLLTSSLLILLGIPRPGFADNPIVQTMFTADPAPLVHNETFYMFTGHDEDGAGWFDMREWRLFATTDMANWTDLGVPMNLKTFPWGTVDAWAAQCIFRNGKFYYYVPIRLSGDKFGIGVGISDKVEGPYTDAIGKPLLEGNSYIDPTVFIDDDGQAYMYWGNTTLWMVKLNPDMISISGSVQTVPLNKETFDNTFGEGPWLDKHDGLYYLHFASKAEPAPTVRPNGSMENLRYSTSTSPTGPWKYRDMIMPAEGKSWTNHPAVAHYKGKSYFVYHNGALPGGGDGQRSVCVEEFTFNADGTIPKIPMTKTGPKQIGTLNPFQTTQAETIAFSAGLKTEKCTDTNGGMDVTSIHNGDTIKVNGVNFGSGSTSFDARVASGTSGGSIELRLDSQTGPLIGTCAIQGTGGAQTWATKSCPVKDATGIHDLYFKFVGTGTGTLFNFNWWKFSGPGADDDPQDAGVTDGGPADAAVVPRDAAVGGKTGNMDAGTATGSGGAGGGTASSSRTGGSTGNSGLGGSAGAAGASGRGGSTGATSAAGGSGGEKATSAAGGSGGSSQQPQSSAGATGSGGASSSRSSSGAGSQSSKADSGSSGCGCNLGSHQGGGIAQLMVLLLGLLLAGRNRNHGHKRPTPRHFLGTVAVALALLGASCSSGSSNSAGGAGSGGQTSQTPTTSSGGQAGASSSSKNGGNSSGGQAGAPSSKDSGGGQAGTASKGGAGGSSSSSTDASCGNGANVTPCGGDVVGTWNVTPSCLKVSGERNIEGISLGCLTVSVTGTIQVNGTWNANADGSYTDKTTTTGEEKLSLGAKCLEVSGTVATCDALNGTVAVLGYESVDCVSAAGGGCTCVAKINQKGGIAFISSDPSTSGTYKISDKGITVGQNALTQEVLQFSYCVSNGKMNWTPKLDGLTYTGAIAFQKGGTGGAGGSGGTTSSGGAGGTGGSSSKGGTTAMGGTISAGSTGKGGTTSSGSSTGGSTSPGTGGPCDIYEAAKTPCVGAYSTVRALYKAYNGPLYQVRKTSDTTALKDIPLLEAGGYANSKVQDDFCTGGCTIAKLYDQSPKKNDLPVSGKTYWLVTTPPAPASHAVATESNATTAKITVAGHTVYGVRTNSGAGNSYRVNAKGTAVGDEPEAMYMVVDAKVYSALCCYDFGNVSTTGNPDGAATMETIYYGNATLFGHGAGKGPWLMADLEAGTYPSSNQNDPNIPSLSYQNYATLMLKGHAGDRFALKAGDAQTGALQTTWDGKRPKGYSPMKKQGAIVLGTGGDGSFLGSGVFFEGAITYGCPDDKAVDDAIQASIVAAGYGK